MTFALSNGSPGKGRFAFEGRSVQLEGRTRFPDGKFKTCAPQYFIAGSACLLQWWFYCDQLHLAVGLVKAGEAVAIAIGIDVRQAGVGTAWPRYRHFDH